MDLKSPTNFISCKCDRYGIFHMYRYRYDCNGPFLSWLWPILDSIMDTVSLAQTHISLITEIWATMCQSHLIHVSCIVNRRRIHNALNENVDFRENVTTYNYFITIILFSLIHLTILNAQTMTTIILLNDDDNVK